LTTAATLAEVTKRFPGGALALDHLSLSVPQGQILVLLGTSGSGKTTALKTINRLVQVDGGESPCSAATSRRGTRSSCDARSGT
jgi:ABC-type proline/glycine betaine transport system ATPase subunit